MSVPGTLTRIRKKVRDLTGSPSESQLTTQDLDDYVNTFILYDFPENIRLFTLRETLKFYTIPNIDVYDETNTLDSAGNPIYDPNTITTILQPIYVSGYQTFFSQSREQFFLIYPITNFNELISTGNNTAGPYNSFLNQTPVLRNNVLISAQDINGISRILQDDGAGNLVSQTVGGGDTGTVNYITGQVNFTFGDVIPPPNEIRAQSIPYVASRPAGVLFFENKFTLRPVPDQVYPVLIEVYRRPTDLISAGSRPQLDQWWQYIAYGAAKKVLEDRQDSDTLAQIYPEFKQQERLVLRRTIVQNTNKRVSTIYTEQLVYPFGFFGQGRF